MAFESLSCILPWIYQVLSWKYSLCKKWNNTNFIHYNQWIIILSILCMLSAILICINIQNIFLFLHWRLNEHIQTHNLCCWQVSQPPNNNWISLLSISRIWFNKTVKELKLYCAVVNQTETWKKNYWVLEYFDRLPFFNRQRLLLTTSLWSFWNYKKISVIQPA